MGCFHDSDRKILYTALMPEQHIRIMKILNIYRTGVALGRPVVGRRHVTFEAPRLAPVKGSPIRERG